MVCLSPTSTAPSSAPFLAATKFGKTRSTIVVLYIIGFCCPLSPALGEPIRAMTEHPLGVRIITRMDIRSAKFPVTWMDYVGHVKPAFVLSQNDLRRLHLFGADTHQCPNHHAVGQHLRPFIAPAIAASGHSEAVACIAFRTTTRSPIIHPPCCMAAIQPRLLYWLHSYQTSFRSCYPSELDILSGRRTLRDHPTLWP